MGSLRKFFLLKKGESVVRRAAKEMTGSLFLCGILLLFLGYMEYS